MTALYYEDLESLALITGGYVDYTLQRVVFAYEVYPEDSAAYVPIEKWGRDHWSTLLYLETRVTDEGGLVRNDKMRTDARLHRGFANERFFGLSNKKYPTRLGDGSTLDNHDDWSCLEDMVVAGLLTAEWWEVTQSTMIGNCKARVKLTPLGRRVANHLREHHADNNSTQGFVPDLEGQNAGN